MTVLERRLWDDAYDAGYFTGWVRGFLTCLAVVVLTFVLMVIL